MPEFLFQRAARRETWCVIALAGPTGGGKTWTALELATGLKGAGRIALISSEGTRDLYYADDFEFDRAPIEPPYTPDNWMAAIKAAAVGHTVVICDNFSDEYTGEGGICDMAEAENTKYAQSHAGRDMNSAAKWARPKAAHKKLVDWIRHSIGCHLIFCLRAEEKVRLIKVKNERGYDETKVEPIGFQPICEKNFMFDMMESALLLPEKRNAEGQIVLADARGVPQWIKPMSKHLAFFPPDKPITRSAGEALAAWCAGGAAQLSDGPPAEPTREPLLRLARNYAAEGTDALRAFLQAQSPADRRFLRPSVGTPAHPGELLQAAIDADNSRDKTASVPAGDPPQPTADQTTPSAGGDISRPAPERDRPIGRTSDFESDNAGSSPAPAATQEDAFGLPPIREEVVQHTPEPRRPQHDNATPPG